MLFFLRFPDNSATRPMDTRPRDSSRHGQLAPWTIRPRTFRPMDNSTSSIFLSGYIPRNQQGQRGESSSPPSIFNGILT
jgi:hypothetical protein